MVVRVNLERIGQNLGKGSTIRLVVAGLSHLLTYHILLGIHTDFLNSGVKHPLGLKPEAQFQIVGGKLLEIVGTVVAGVGIERAARIRHISVIGMTGNILGSLEHKVLEEVSKTSKMRFLILRTHMIHY